MEDVARLVAIWLTNYGKILRNEIYSQGSRTHEILTKGLLCQISEDRRPSEFSVNLSGFSKLEWPDRPTDPIDPTRPAWEVFRVLCICFEPRERPTNGLSPSSEPHSINFFICIWWLWAMSIHRRWHVQRVPPEGRYKCFHCCCLVTAGPIALNLICN